MGWNKRAHAHTHFISARVFFHVLFTFLFTALVHFFFLSWRCFSCGAQRKINVCFVCGRVELLCFRKSNSKLPRSRCVLSIFLSLGLHCFSLQIEMMKKKTRISFWFIRFYFSALSVVCESIEMGSKWKN